jgi:hypothetical protein
MLSLVFSSKLEDALSKVSVVTAAPLSADYLALDGLEDDPMLQIQGYSITYRIATPALGYQKKGWQ